MHRSNPLRRRLSGALACLLAVAAPIAAQNVIADLVPPTSDGDGQPFAGVVMNGVAYFEVELNQDVLEDEAARVRVAEDFRALIAADALANDGVTGASFVRWT